MNAPLHRFLAAFAVVIALAALVGCALYRNDKCYVPEEQYKVVRDLYLRTGSLDLVERKLKDYQWRRCRINESIYRLTKEFQVLPGAPTRFEKPTTTTQTVTQP